MQKRPILTRSPTQVPDPKCHECGGSGKIVLFTSIVSCALCESLEKAISIVESGFPPGLNLPEGIVVVDHVLHKNTNIDRYPQIEDEYYYAVVGVYADGDFANPRHSLFTVDGIYIGEY